MKAKKYKNINEGLNKWCRSHLLKLPDMFITFKYMVKLSATIFLKIEWLVIILTFPFFLCVD